MPTRQEFQEQVIDRIALTGGSRTYNYQQYLSEMPVVERTGDEANAVDQQFSRYVLEWLGFTPADWTYNQPVNGHKSDRPDYVVRGTVGTAFIWENKNSTLSLEGKHLQQMRRYASGTSGYAVWCNMSRILAVRFLTSEGAGHEVITDVSVAKLFGVQPALPDEQEAQAENLDLLKLLFSKERFTQFASLVARVAVSEDEFKNNARSVSEKDALRHFIADSRQSLNHLRLAALSQIRDAVTRDTEADSEEKRLRAEWNEAQAAFLSGVDHNGGSVQAALNELIPGEIDRAALQRLETIAAQARGTRTLPATLRVHYERWLERSERIDAALRTVRFTRRNTLRVAEAYRAWSSNQRDTEDVHPAIFAEQVAYVFFVRLLLVRVLEDKGVIGSRIASNGGFGGWVAYLKQHFRELDGISILNESYCGLLTRKASSFYLHFFQQPVFDWFIPDDYLLVETLEFLSRYRFEDVASDVIGFTYEEYIDRNARSRKGHFLTRPEVVDYMLDLLGYNSAEVIGQRILDPACGSGSFLVHAARRYRAALVAGLCQREGLPLDEQSLSARPNLREELARTYLSGLAENFHGMEINPFSCYLAEMNLLIQLLDDLAHLQKNTTEGLSIERFRIFNTNSLELPYAVLHTGSLTDAEGQPTVQMDYLSERITDEAFPVKAKLNGFASGFAYIIFNPPYVSSKREQIDVQRLRDASFFADVLSGATNLFLPFLRLAAYYLADYGRTVFIIPLTIFGDISSAAARRLLCAAPLSPSAAIRFFRGDILFPGVDQAVGILRIEKSVVPEQVLVAGGNTIEDVRANEYELPAARVLGSVPVEAPWNGVWLVANEQIHADIWEQARQKSQQLTHTLGSLLHTTFGPMRQGDVNATHLNPARLGNGGSFTQGNVAIYKGEQIQGWGSLPLEPSDWSVTQTQSNVPQVIASVKALRRIAQLTGEEFGIILRQVARLNTRDRLIATWFRRDSTEPVAFTNELWRMNLRPDASLTTAKALLAYLNSKTAAFLINLFSSNNHVGSEELNRVPIPPVATFPEAELSQLADSLLQTRRSLDDILRRYGASLPEAEDADAVIYIPPAAVLASDTARPKTTVSNLVLQDVLHNTGSATARLLSLNARSRILIHSPAKGNAEAVTEVLRAFLTAPALQNKTWFQIQNEALPAPAAAVEFRTRYHAEQQAAQALWQRFLELQVDVDNVVSDWYGFNEGQRAAVAAGLPWARRKQPAVPKPLAPYQPQLERQPVQSSVVAAIGYNEADSLLEIEFIAGSVQGYFPVTRELYEEFRQAESKGTFYNERIKGVIPHAALEQASRETF